jgi:drug/metabolite transporter (DMT)-like permease
MSLSRQAKLNLLAISACLLWSSAFVSVKYALLYLPPLVLAGLRFLLAALFQIPFCKTWKAPFQLIKSHFSTVLLVSLFHTVYLYGTFFIALQWVRGAEAAIIIGAGPLASALMAHLLMPDDRLQPRTLTGILLGLSGVALISLSSQPWHIDGLKEFAGLMLLLSGSFVSALGNIIVARQKGGLHPIALNSAQMLIGGPILLLIAAIFGTLSLPPLSLSFWGLLCWLAIISAVGFGIWFHLLGQMKVSRLNLWKFIIPLSGAILSWLLIPSESPTPLSLTGMLLILLGLFMGQKNYTEETEKN